MILVTLGTQKFEFERLAKAMDELAPKLGEEVFIQLGNTQYQTKNCKSQDFVNKEIFQKMIAECSVLVTHSGVGSIITGVNAGVPVVVLPRLAKYHEHVDDHQVQIAEAFEKKNCVIYCKKAEDLEESIKKARNHKFDPYEMKGGKIEDIILNYLLNI